MVRAVPLDSGLTEFAINEDSNGESAITEILHISKNIINRMLEFCNSINGESKQHIPEIIRAYFAVFLAPIFSDKQPPIIHPIAPIEITVNANNEIFSFASAWLEL